MARRPLPRILSNGTASIARSRELARSAADSATDVLHPLITITRGLRRLAAAGRRRWTETPKDKRSPLLFLVASVVLVVALVPFGPLLAAICLMAAAAWTGRERTAPEPEGPDDAQTQRLQSLYEALVPYFSVPEDPAPLFAHGGEWDKAFTEYDFDDTGRISRLVVRYPAYFTDGEAESRARIEQLLHAKSGRGREYHFAWDEEGNQLTVSVLSPLPTDIAAQRFVTAPGEAVLGFTDETGVQRTLPVTDGEEHRDVPPVVWRTGFRSTEPHLLIAGQPGSGTTTLLRSIALQALQYGDVLIVEGSGTGDYACLTGRGGVLAVECGLTGALASLEWAAHETERRLISANRARQAGHPPPEDTKRPLWILLDRPSILGHLAAADGRRDPQSLLQVPLRHGRAANVTVVVADQLDTLDALSEAVHQHTRARVLLGPATVDQLEEVLGAPPHTTPTSDVPPGRGYARLGRGPVHRLQVPATPDPYDDATSEAHRRAVMELLPEPIAEPDPADTTATEPLPEAAEATETAPQTPETVPVPAPVEAAPEAAGARPVPAES
ncbi:ATP-binding protein [Streptomyces sp. NPDC058284]|uniref:ATP-binding protein n=1 Tax=unclassified Streptomyces TaxID=2593676 RepID=UPI00365EAE7B